MEFGQQPVVGTAQLGHKDKNLKKSVMVLLVTVVLLAAGAGAGYFWRDKDAKDQTKSMAAEITALKGNLNAQEKELTAAKAEIAKNEAVKKSSDNACTGTSTDELANIKDAISSGNTAALEDYMQPSVNVILAASEAYGPQTPTQTIKDLDYLNDGKNPWDFNLAAATINSYQKGDYKQYFPNGSFVGKSTNKYVVSFQFDSCVKIYGIFMAASSDLL